MYCSESLLNISADKMKALRIIGISIGGVFAIGIMGLVILGSIAPETYVYLGHQVPKKYLKEVRALDLLSEDEKIKYFYTDGLVDIKDGMYFVTDRNLVLYCNYWEEPETIIDFNEITNLEVEYDDSFLNDSMIYVETKSGLEVSFPVSSERGRDKKFVEHIRQKSGIE